MEISLMAMGVGEAKGGVTHVERTRQSPREVPIDAVRRIARSPASGRVLEVCNRFGITRDAERIKVVDGVRIGLGPGRIVLLQGPSGSGKTVLLAELARRCPRSRLLDHVSFRESLPIVDQVLPSGTLQDALGLLTTCALGEPRLWLRLFTELSDGERFRARLARAIGLMAGGNTTAPLLCDDFCAVLGRRAARAMAHNLRRLVGRLGLCLVLATTHEDLETDLQPDQIVRMLGPGRHIAEHRRPVRRAMSLARRLVIEPGRCRDYRDFAAMHYRQRDELGFVDRVFVMRDRKGGQPVGIVLYAHAPLELALRNQATTGRFKRNAKRLNRELRILRRLVIAPDLRGCGFGRILVERTLPQVGVRFVECLANMGDVIPVFERAGMKRIGQCPLPSVLLRVDRQLSEAGVDPMSAAFVAEIGRRPRIRRLVAHAVFRWYCGLTNQNAATERVARQSAEVLARNYRQLRGSRPVYYLWERPK